MESVRIQYAFCLNESSSNEFVFIIPNNYGEKLRFRESVIVTRGHLKKSNTNEVSRPRTGRFGRKITSRSALVKACIRNDILVMGGPH